MLFFVCFFFFVFVFFLKTWGTWVNMNIWKAWMLKLGNVFFFSIWKKEGFHTHRPKGKEGKKSHRLTDPDFFVTLRQTFFFFFFLMPKVSRVRGFLYSYAKTLSPNLEFSSSFTLPFYQMELSDMKHHYNIAFKFLWNWYTWEVHN